MANEMEVKRDRNPSTGDAGRWPDFDSMFDQLFDHRMSSLFGDFPGFGSSTGMPAFRRSTMNVQENDRAYCLTAEIPGIPQEDIEINVNGNLLTVRAEHREESGDEESERGFRRQYRKFSQSFSLPNSVNADGIQAQYDNGLLEIILPKAEVTGAKKIEVQSGKGGLWNRLFNKGEKTDATNERRDPNVKH